MSRGVVFLPSPHPPTLCLAGTDHFRNCSINPVQTAFWNSWLLLRTNKALGHHSHFKDEKTEVRVICKRKWHNSKVASPEWSPALPFAGGSSTGPQGYRTHVRI